ncbi:hypothetical protein [Tabrizicola soli]|uniref:ATP-binding protein n=1 Tax=Tabrizicola soli TaxID=2185115 RepID=A0ABV7DWE8_9RHOB|nr:hypothetical protein [Tabrizicola soli]
MNHANAMPDIAEDEAPSDQLAEIAMPFRTPAGVLFAEVMQDGHSEIWPINGDKFAELIQRLQRKETGQIFPKKDLTRFIDTLKAEAQFGDVVEDVHLRVARAADRIYIDLCDPDWRVIEIDATGWRILEHSPIRFRRTAGMLPLPDPVPSGSLDALWDFLRIDDPGERLLVIAHLLGTLAGVQPFPLLYLFGSQGTAKTTATEILGSLVDPRVSGVRSMPKSERDLFLAAQHGHLLTFDNVSTITHSMSDALCRLATGATFATRKNYSDADEVYLSACNPIICNGIGHSFVRPDLADRTITVTLSKVPDDERQPHAAVMRAFEAARPSLLGALCAALSTGLGRQNSIAQSTPLPRMADFALWGIACEPAYAKEEGAFLSAYQRNIRQINEATIDEDPLAPRICEILARRDIWEGTATRLDETLRGTSSLPVPQDWPRSARLLSDHLRRIAPALSRIGISLRFDRRGHGRERIIRLCREEL